MNCEITGGCDRKADWITTYKWLAEQTKIHGCISCSRATNGPWETTNFKVEQMLIIDEHCAEQANPDPRRLQMAILELMDDCLSDNPSGEDIFNRLGQLYLIAGGEEKKLPILFKGKFNAK